MMMGNWMGRYVGHWFGTRQEELPDPDEGILGSGAGGGGGGGGGSTRKKRKTVILSQEEQEQIALQNAAILKAIMQMVTDGLLD